jgi:hypothetical protein
MGRVIRKNKEMYSVSVDEDLQDKAMEHSLCYRCNRLMGGNVDQNCKIENILYAVSKAFGLSVPVYECPAFAEKPKEVQDGTVTK